MWYYLENGAQQGPVDDAQLNELITGGKVGPETLVWKEGEAAWAPLQQLRPFPPSPIVSSADSFCAVCQKPMGADDLIELQGVKVCAACKPRAVQAMMEGVAIRTHDVAWRDGKRVVISDGESLPERCVKCNAPANGAAFKRKLYWHPPLYYLLIFVSLIVYVLVAIFVRKYATVHAHLCEKHVRSRRYCIIGAWLLVGVFFFCFVLAIGYNEGWLGYLAAASLIASIVIGLAGGRVVYATKIKDKTVWLGGAGKEFVASLAPWAGK